MNEKKNVILLTTRTTHHNFFINQISKICNLFLVFEKKKIKPIFETRHSYEIDQNIYEKKTWFNNKNFKIHTKSKILDVFDINDVATSIFIKKNNPDIIFSFGISKLNRDFLKKINKNIYNFHGGDTSFYRGLDSHLWSLYHNDINGLKVTLHQIDNDLDTGGIIFKKKLNLKKTNKLHQVRLLNTNVCVSLAKKFIMSKSFKVRKLKKLGRYYSYMPGVLKNVINKNYIKKLKIIYNDY